MSLSLHRLLVTSSATRIILSHRDRAVRRALSTLPKRSNSASAAAYSAEYEDALDGGHDSRTHAPLNSEQRKFLDSAVSISIH
jgi:hypothetical protein